MRVILFEDGLKGFGTAEVSAPSESNTPVYPAQGRYHRTLNMDCRFGGAIPAWGSLPMGTVGVGATVYCFNWRDNNGLPLVVFAGGKSPYRYQDGSRTAESAFAANCTGAAIWEDGSGASVLIVGFDNAAVVKKRTTTANGWSATGDAKVGKIAAVGADLYAQTHSGAFSSYRVGKCLAGNDPTDASNWSGGERVGHPAWAVNGIADGGGFPVVGKPDGLFVWNNVDSEYKNKLAFLEGAPHPDNCKGMKAVSDGVLVPLADGSLWLFDGFGARRVSGDFSPNQDTVAALGRITAIVDVGATIYAFIDTHQRATQEPNLVVKKEDGGVFTTLTTNATDGKLSTTIALGGLGTTTTDYLYVGADVPLVGINVVVGTANTANEAFRDTRLYVNSSWLTYGMADTTARGALGLSADGFLGVFGNAVESAAPDPMTQTKTTVDSVEAYWIRFTVTATGFSATTTLLEVRAVPGRASVGVSSFDHTGRDLAGCGIVHVLAGVRRGGEIVWHDNLAIVADGPIGAACITDALRGLTTGGGTTLVAPSGMRLQVIPMGAIDNPLVVPCPVLASGATREPMPVLYPCRVRFPERMRAKSFHIDVEHFDNADTLELFMRWDQSPFFAAGTLKNAPGAIDLEGRENSGLCLEVAVAYDDAASTELFAPRIRRIEVEVERTGERFDTVPYLQEQVPSVE